MIYTPSEICARSTGVTPRQITDLAEKGIIQPAKDTPGQGSMRLYDKQNIRDILIALALRGYVAGDALKGILLKINECGSGVNIVSIKHGKKKNIFHIAAVMEGAENLAGSVKFGSDAADIATPRSFLVFWLDVAEIDNFIKSNF